MGGAVATEKRLDLMFVPNLRTTDLGVGVGSGTTLFNPGKSRMAASHTKCRSNSSRSYRLL